MSHHNAMAHVVENDGISPIKTYPNTTNNPNHSQYHGFQQATIEQESSASSVASSPSLKQNLNMPNSSNTKLPSSASKAHAGSPQMPPVSHQIPQLGCHQQYPAMSKARNSKIPPDKVSPIFLLSLPKRVIVHDLNVYTNRTFPFTHFFRQINLKLILVSGKTKEFLFSPSDSAADIARHVYDHWPEGKLSNPPLTFIAKTSTFAKHYYFILNYDLHAIHILIALTSYEFFPLTPVLIVFIICRVGGRKCYTSRSSQAYIPRKISSWQCHAWR